MIVNVVYPTFFNNIVYTMISMNKGWAWDCAAYLVQLSTTQYKLRVRMAGAMK